MGRTLDGMSQHESQSAEVMIAPGAGTAITAGNGAAGTAVDLSTHRDKFVALRFPGKTHIRFAASAALAQAVVTTDFYLSADELQCFKIIDGLEFVAAWGVGGAHAGTVGPVSR